MTWKRLVKHDPALKPSLRKKLRNVPNQADRALKEVLLAFGIPESDLQEYLEAHLLALPGWAGRMLWRLRIVAEDKTLLMEYLAVRLSMEWTFITPYLPFSQQKVENQVSL